MSTLELTNEEIAYIESERKTERERIRKQQSEALQEKLKVREQRLAECAHVTSLAHRLQEADTDKVLKYRYGQDEDGFSTVKITFDYRGHDEVVQLSEHRVMRSSYRVSSRGLKYRLCGSYNNYQDRHYTRPATVIIKVKEFQLAITREREAQKSRSSLQERSVAELIEKYPQAEVIPIQGYEGHGRGYKSRPDRFRVETDVGYYEFVSHERDDKIIFQVYNKHINDEKIAAKVQAMVLGS